MEEINTIQKQDSVILYKSKLCIFKLEHNTYNTKLKIHHKEIIGKRYNTLYKGAYLLRPYPSTYIETCKRQTQILFESDISLIIHLLDIKKDYKIIESGTGSGVLTHFLSQHGGVVYTYEVNKERYEVLKNSFMSDTSLNNVIIKNENILTYEFIGEEVDVDAVFLDIPNPKEVIKKCNSVLKPGRKICVFLPGAEQVLNIREEMIKYFVDLKMFENIKRDFINEKTSKKGLSVSNVGYSHTGFLIIATKQ